MSFKNHMEIPPCQLPVILAVYIILNPNYASYIKKKKTQLIIFVFSLL